MTMPAEREYIPRLQVAPPAAPVVAEKPGVTDTNPVRLAGAVQGILPAIITVLVAFNLWSPSDTQLVAVTGLYTAVVVAASELARGKVYSPATVAKLTEAARR